MSAASSGVALIGVPWDGSSSFLRGAARGPSAIRDALWSPSSNSWTEGGIDLAQAKSDGRFVDGGDVDVGATADESVRLIRDGVERVLGGGRHVVSLGGDHSVTYPILMRSTRGAACVLRCCTLTRMRICRPTCSTRTGCRTRVRSRE